MAIVPIIRTVRMADRPDRWRDLRHQIHRVRRAPPGAANARHPVMLPLQHPLTVFGHYS